MKAAYRYGLASILGLMFFGVFVPADAFAATSIYYSVGQNTSDHKTGTPTVTIDLSGNATFSVAQTATNMGMGDKVTYGGSSVYITGKTSTTVWTVETATGTLPVATTSATVTSITHAYSSLKSAVGIGVANNATSTNMLNTSDLTSGNYVLNIPLYFDSGPDTTSVNISGYTTNSSDYINIYTPTSTLSQVNQSQRHAGVYNTSKWAIEVTNPSAIIDVGSGNVHLDGLQIKYTQTSSTASAVRFLSTIPTGGEIWLSDSIIRGALSGGTGAQGLLLQSNASGARTAKIWNDVFYGFELGATTNFNAISINTSWTAYIDNNTFWDDLYAINRLAGGGAAYNNLISSTTNPTSGFNGSVSSDYNSTDNTSLGTGNGGLHNRVSQTFSFTNISSPSSADFHLLSSDTGAKDLGVDASASSTLAFNYDIDGDSRPQGTAWDIGADEYAAPAAPTVSTSAATSVTPASMVLNGTISSIGGASVTQSGFAYGTSSSLSSLNVATTTLGSQSGPTSFNETVSSLSCNTAYYYRTYATNSIGTGFGSILSTTTSACDTTPPVISAIASSTLNTSVTISWTTDELSTSTVEYGLTNSYGNSTTSASLATSHSLSITGLASTTLYHFRVSSTDSSGNRAVSGDYTFFTEGESIYVAQSSAGGDTGSDCSDAHSITWLNTSTNWGTADISNQVDPGDTVYLCGTITSAVTIQGSGTSGFPITLLFEPGAKMSTAAWPSTGAIALTQKNYITIDGGATGIIGGPNGNAGLANGIIEDTNNGVSLGNQVDSVGIAAIESSHLTVKGIVIQNLYVRSAGGDQNSYGKAVKVYYNGGITGYGNDLVTNSIFHDMYAGYNITYTAGSANFEYSSTTAYNVNWGGNAADYNSSATLAGLYVHDDRFYNWTNWDDTLSNSFHHNGFFGWAVNGGTLSTVRYYNNYIGPNFSSTTDATNHSSSGLFVQQGVTDVMVYNNLFVENTNDYPADGLVYINPSQNLTSTYRVYNNTFIGGSKGIAINVTPTTSGGAQATGALTFSMKNNIASGVATFIGVYQDATAIIDSDYNLGYNLFAGREFSLSANSSSVFQSFAQWQNLGYDAHSSSANPLLDGSYVPQAGSPAIDSATDLSAYFTNDKNGTSRPQGGAWDMGAYEYSGSGVAPGVTTSAASSITTTGAVLNGSISSTNGSNATQRGFAYSTDSALSTGVSTTTLGSQTGIGSFVQTVSNLSCNTKYYFRAYATNGGGTGLGSIQSFTTSACVTSSTSSATLVVSGLGGGFASVYTAPIFAPGYAPSANTSAVPAPVALTPALKAKLQALPVVIRPLDVGVANRDVKSVQTILNDLGFTVAKNGPGSPGHETTYFGPLTKKAVEAFQLYYKIATPKDAGFGYVGPKTRAKVNSFVR